MWRNALLAFACLGWLAQSSGADVMQRRLAGKIQPLPGLEGRQLEPILDALADEYGVPIWLDTAGFEAAKNGKLKSQAIKIGDFKDRDLRALLARLSAQVDGAIVEKHDVVVVVPRQKATPAYLLKQRVSIDVYKQPLEAVLQQLTGETGLPITIASNASQRRRCAVSLTLDNVTLEIALLILADQTGLMPKTGKTVVLELRKGSVAPPASPRQQVKERMDAVDLGHAIRGQGVSILSAIAEMSGGAVRRFGTVPFRSLKASSLAFSPDGKHIAAWEEEAIRIMDVATGKTLRWLRFQRGRGTCLSYSPDGRFLVGERESYYGNGLVVLDSVTGRPLASFETPALSTEAAMLAGKTDPKQRGGRCWSFSRDSRYLALLEFGQIALIEMATGQLKHSYWARQDAEDLALSADGKRLAVVHKGGAIQVLDMATGDIVTRIRKAHALSVAFTPDGRSLASSGESCHRLWDPSTGKLLQTFPGGLDGILSWSPDGTSLLENNPRTHAYQVRDAATGKVLATDKCKGPHALSADGKLLAEAGSNSIQVTNLSTKKVLSKKPQPPGKLLDLRFSLDGKQVIAKHEDVSIRWDRSRDDAPGKTSPTPVDRVVNRFWNREKPRAATARALTLDRKLAATYEYRGRPEQIVFWEVLTGDAVGAIPVANVHVIEQLGFSNDFKLLAGAGHRLVGLWDPVGMTLQSRNRMHGYGCTALAFSPDDRYLALANRNGIFIHEVSTLELVLALSGHPRQPAERLAFSPDGLFLASAATDTATLLWDLRPELTWDGPRSMDRLWTDLNGRDAMLAYQAVWQLAAVPAKAVPFLAARCPVPGVKERQQAAQLIANLESTNFKLRQEATSNLKKMGLLALPILQREKQNKHSLECTRRLQDVMNAIQSPAGSRRLWSRAIHVLKLIHTPEARQVLKTLADHAELVIAADACTVLHELDQIYPLPTAGRTVP